MNELCTLPGVYGGIHTGYMNKTCTLNFEFKYNSRFKIGCKEWVTILVRESLKDIILYLKQNLFEISLLLLIMFFLIFFT